MNGKELLNLVQSQLSEGQSIAFEVVRNPGLFNNQAIWAFKEGKLYVSPAAETILLDPETSEEALNNLEISWVPTILEALS